MNVVLSTKLILIPTSAFTIPYYIRQRHFLTKNARGIPSGWQMIWPKEKMIKFRVKLQSRCLLDCPIDLWSYGPMDLCLQHSRQASSSVFFSAAKIDQWCFSYSYVAGSCALHDKRQVIQQYCSLAHGAFLLIFQPSATSFCGVAGKLRSHIVTMPHESNSRGVL